LREKGHQAAVVHLTRHRRPEADEVYYPQTAWETARILLREPADILHPHIGGSLTSRLLGLCLYCTLLPGRKSVLSFHSGGFCSSPEAQAVNRNSSAARILRRLDAIIAINRQIADFMVERCAVPPERVHLISPHVTVQAGAELPERLEAFFAAHDPALLSVGLLEPEYELPLQIEALGTLLESHPNAGLMMIGSGSLEPDLRARIDAVPYSDRLLLAGDVPHPVTLRAIRECSILLRTTRYDGDALSVREALDLGTPVIATDNGMRPPGCRLIPNPSLEPLLIALRTALAEPPRQRIAAADRDTSNLDAVLDVYRSVLG
jgi:glycogen synthase